MSTPSLSRAKKLATASVEAKTSIHRKKYREGMLHESERSTFEVYQIDKVVGIWPETFRIKQRDDTAAADKYYGDFPELLFRDGIY